MGKVDVRNYGSRKEIEKRDKDGQKKRRWKKEMVRKMEKECSWSTKKGGFSVFLLIIINFQMYCYEDINQEMVKVSMVKQIYEYLHFER